MGVLLEVQVAQVRDVPGALEGGADRLFLSVGDGRSPDLPVASAVLRESDRPVRLMLRLSDGYSTTGGEFVRLVGLAEEYLALGAEGVSFGFLDGDLEVDARTCVALAEALPGVPWTFHRAIDTCLDTRRAWRRVVGLPGLTAVASAGSVQGLAQGYDDLLARAESDTDVARLLMPAGGLSAEQVPWFLRVGVQQVHIDRQARPGGSDKAYVDSALVRSWRLLLDGGAAGGDR
jgi:copper homeostasis protein